MCVGVGGLTYQNNFILLFPPQVSFMQKRKITKRLSPTSTRPLRCGTCFDCLVSKKEGLVATGYCQPANCGLSTLVDHICKCS